MLQCKYNPKKYIETIFDQLQNSNKLYRKSKEPKHFVDKKTI